jgi:predicted HTH transcriptional regulator
MLGILVTLFKNKYSSEQLQKLGLNKRQVKSVLYILYNGSIANSKYQELNAVGKTLATEELKQLVHKDIIKQADS